MYYDHETGLLLLQPQGWAAREAEDELGPDAAWPDVHAHAWALIKADEEQDRLNRLGEHAE